MTTDIIYRYKNQVYFNITNKCPCRCTFCIRNTEDAIGEASNLWFEHDLHWKRFTKPLMSLIFQTVMKWFSADTENRPWLLRTL